LKEPPHRRPHLAPTAWLSRVFSYFPAIHPFIPAFLAILSFFFYCIQTISRHSVSFFVAAHFWLTWTSTITAIIDRRIPFIFGAAFFSEAGI
jgi:hypothetical protein